jgi:hypothetical protein
MKIKCECYNCGKEVHKRKEHFEGAEKHFCNWKCYKEYLQRNAILLKTECNFCGKDIIRNRREQRRSRTGLFFCCNLCKNRFLAKNRRWRADSTYGHRHRTRFLLEIANNACQNCNYNEYIKMLETHHYDHDHQNNNYENLRILCVWCHAKHHRLKEEYDLPILTTEEEMKEKIIKFTNGREAKFVRKEKIRRKKNRKVKIEEARNCIICDENFVASLKKQKYCSHKCAREGARKVKDRPSKEQLLKEVQETNYCAVGRKYGVCDNSIRKWLKSNPIT